MKLRMKSAAPESWYRGTRTIRLPIAGKSMMPLIREPMVLEVATLAGTAREGNIIVFADRGSFIAHRVVSVTAAEYSTAGDAQPWLIESVPKENVIGIAVGVWSDRSPQARRIDGSIFRLCGFAFARFHGVRFLLSTAKRRFLSAMSILSPFKRPRTTLAFIALLRREIRGHSGGACDIEQPALKRIALRHRCSAVFARAINATDCRKEITRARLRTAQMHQEVNGVVKVLQDAKVTVALLKGAARVYSGHPEASDHPSDDIDVFVKLQDMDAACAALRAAGYVHRCSEPQIERYRRKHHHAAPLFHPARRYSVEVHHALAPPGALSTALEWISVEEHLCWIDGAAGKVMVLDDVASALHLAAHAIALRRLRDIFLLAQRLRRLNTEQTRELQRITKAESRDPVRLTASFVLAAWLAGVPWPCAPNVTRYLDWALRRSDLPRYLRAHADIADAFYALTPLNASLVASVVFGEQPKTLVGTALLPARITKHALDGMCAAVYARLMPSR